MSLIHNPATTLIDRTFPVADISDSCSREKSIRHGHISTLQMWWARRPLAVCRAAIFASLFPDPDVSEIDITIKHTIDRLLPGEGKASERLNGFIGKLSEWETCKDESVLDIARELLCAIYKRPPMVVDTFAGGGSFPIEALRLGVDAYGSDLNPVAVTALRLALELLPGTTESLIERYKTACGAILSRIYKVTPALYGPQQEGVALAYFWCRTYVCPKCGIEVPLLRNQLLASSGSEVIVSFTPDAASSRFIFSVITNPTAEEIKSAQAGTIAGRGAKCPQCSHQVTTSWLQEVSKKGKIGDRLYAKRLLLSDGKIIYKSCDINDEALAAKAALRRLHGRRLNRLPEEMLDINGIRHTWAIQYGVRSTADLFNQRQGIALLELQHEISEEIDRLEGEELSLKERQAIATLLTLTLNRLLMYNSRHAWWQPNGQFPASMFVRQAIPMVWNYVEIPIDSPAAGGISSASQWLSLAAEHCQKLPNTGIAEIADAASCKLPDYSADLVTIDPPYYDSVVYAYLADVFYVWMKPLLQGYWPELFSTPTIIKAEEAIVDRPHKLARNLKTDAHFRTKMRDAFKEARRVLKPGGRMLLMFGHKKPEAWDAVMSGLFDAGFVPLASWPVHTERKAKLRHGHIAALSTSCLLVCAPASNSPKHSVTWEEIIDELKAVIRDCVENNRNNYLYGSDFFTATIAPTMTVFRRYACVYENGKPLCVEDFIAKLPGLVAQSEVESLLAHSILDTHGAVREWLLGVAAKGDSQDARMLADLEELRHEDALIGLALDYSGALISGRQFEADEIWAAIPSLQKEGVRILFEVLALISEESTVVRQWADASLGRIAMRLRQSREQDDTDYGE